MKTDVIMVPHRIPQPHLTRRAFVSGAAGLSTLSTLPARSQADGYPRRPVQLVLPFATGGSGDLIARAFTPAMSTSMGQQVVVVNQGGGGGLTAAQTIANAAPDGYTVAFFSMSASVLNVGLHPNLHYDIRSFVPVSLGVTLPMMLVVGNHVPARNLVEFMALLRRQPGSYSYGSAGLGTINHLAGQMVAKRAGGSALHVPYRGAGPAIVDIIAGHIDFIIEGVPSLLQQVKAGQLRALAVTTPARSPLLPEVPTLAEAGMPDFVIQNWLGVFAPPATPAAVVNKLQASVTSAMHDPAVVQRLRKIGADPAGSTSQEFQAFWDSQFQLWLPVIKESGVKVE